MNEVINLTNFKKGIIVSDRDFKHKNKERLCHCCDTLQDSKDSLYRLEINKEERGSGSNFDECDIAVQLCPNCYKEQYEQWFNENPVLTGGYYENYKHEDDITNLINSFPLENQEYIWNHMDKYPMKRQDWLNMKKGILPDYKYKEYNMDSPSEIKTYNERFTTCHNPINIIYKDGTKGCGCVYGAYGDYNQEANVNISTECYNCKYYKKREEPIKTITNEDYELFEQAIKGKIAEERLEETLNKNT